jgi:L-lactate dehydrogenase complex protein LldG
MSGTETADRFASRAAEYGVDVTRVPSAEAPAAIEAALEEPAVGAPLPWEDASLPSLPAGVTTDPTPAELNAARTGVTAASLAVADYGSLLLRADEAGSEPISLFVDRHVAVLRAADIVPGMSAAFEWLGPELRETRDSVIVATGPSATADMGALVQGAHGPKTVAVVIVE